MIDLLAQLAALIWAGPFVFGIGAAATPERERGGGCALMAEG